MNTLEWVWNGAEKYGDVKRSLECKMVPGSLDVAVGTAQFKGSKSGEIYNATLRECDCPAFCIVNKHRAPCKHMIALGRELGVFHDLYDNMIA